MTRSKDEWIGVDLDGTLFTYDRWRGVAHVGEPIMPMVDRIHRWLAMGIKVKIFTARVAGCATPDMLAEIAMPIWKALEACGLPKLEVTNIKDFQMIELWDDRAVAIEHNTGRILGGNTRV